MKSSTLEMQRMLLLIRLKLVKYLKLIVTNMNFKKTFMKFQTAYVIQKDYCALCERCFHEKIRLNHF